MNPTEELKKMMAVVDPFVIRSLLDAGADINVQNERGLTVLMYTVGFVLLQEWCTELLQRGASIHFRSHEDGWTAWDFLCPYNDPHLFSLFLQYGTDVNQYNPNGYTALHRVCQSNNRAVITLLITQGADPRLPVLSGYHKGKTAYDLGDGTFWRSPDGIRARRRWNTVSIQEVFILASERGLIPIPSYLW